QTATDPNTGENILGVDQGASGNNAINKVPDLFGLSLLPLATAEGGLGEFLDDDGIVASVAPFVATSLGAPGPTVNGLVTWQSIDDGPLPASVLPDNGPAPTTLPGTKWGQEVEDVRMARMAINFYKGGTNFTDTYYPNAGPSVTSITGVCTS